MHPGLGVCNYSCGHQADLPQIHLLDGVMAPSFIGRLVILQIPSVDIYRQDTFIEPLILDFYLHLPSLRATAIAAPYDLDRETFSLYNCSGLKCLGGKSRHICQNHIAGCEAEMKGREGKGREEKRREEKRRHEVAVDTLRVMMS